MLFYRNISGLAARAGPENTEVRTWHCPFFFVLCLSLSVSVFFVSLSLSLSFSLALSRGRFLSLFLPLST